MIEIKGKLNIIKYIYYLIKTFGLLHSVKLLIFIYDFHVYLSRVYEFQNNANFYDNIEGLLRKTSPTMYTLSQNSFKEIIKQMNFSEKIDHFTNLTCMKLLGQNNSRVTGLAGIHSIFSYFSPSYSDNDIENISIALLNKCKYVRLLLNTHVTKVSYQLNQIVYKTENSEFFTKNYDYIVIAFPLTKVKKKIKSNLKFFIY